MAVWTTLEVRAYISDYILHEAVCDYLAMP